MSVRQRLGARRPANPPARDAESAPVTWLTAAELDSWLSLVRLVIWLPWCIDPQLRRDSDLAIVEYQVLAMLSQAPDRTMWMSSLAEVTNASLSRLSHLSGAWSSETWSVASPTPRTGASPAPS